MTENMGCSRLEDIQRYAAAFKRAGTTRFHVEQPDIVKRLRDIGKLPIRDTIEFRDMDVWFDAADEIEQLRQKLFELGEEAKLWQDRYEAEKQDHEATMKAWDEERSGL